MFKTGNGIPEAGGVVKSSLRKLEEKSVIFYKRLISDIMSDIGTFFPAALSLEEQGRFILGYYQQNQSLYTANSKEPIKNTEVDK